MKKFIMGLAGVLALAACQQKAAEPQLGLTEEQFGTAQVDGKDLKLYTLKGKSGITAQFTNLGAKVVSLYTQDRNGVYGDVVFGYATAADYAKCDWMAGVGEPVFGATIGRYGNRIKDGKFSLNGKDYELQINENGVNNLHGGCKGYHSVVWDVKAVCDTAIMFALRDTAGHMGYPGNVDVEVTYTLTACNALKIEYKAVTDEATPINLTHHSFFNLTGEKDAETINDHLLMIPSANITPVDDKLIPTGELMAVEGTPFDFNVAHAIADSIESEHPQMKLGMGYDHNWILNSEVKCPKCVLRLAAELTSPKSGRVMTVYTSEPAIQVYGGNFLNGKQIGKSGKGYPYRSAICLETQHYPDSPNKAEFPSTILNPGETYSHVCVYKFSVVE